MSKQDLPQDPRAPYEPTIWGTRAQHLVEQAMGEVIDGIDAISTLEGAIACLKAEAGELKPDDLADLEKYFAGPVCTCPPDLLARGGFRGGCPVHSSTYRRAWADAAEATR